MIVAWGPPGDATLRAVLDALDDHGAEVAFIDQSHVLEHTVHLDAGERLTAWLDRPDTRLDLTEVGAAYLRGHDATAAPAVAAAGPDEADHARQVDERLTLWAEVTDAFVVNPPSAMASNHCKPYQTAFARSVGFAVPETLLTTDPVAVREFAAAHEAVIYKSISGIRSIVTRLGPEDLERLDDVTWCPTQFQARVPGTDVRVHVVGDEVFACAIESEADDYRYGDSAIEAVQLPGEVAARCVELATRLRLPVTGIDLRRTPADEWYCFEANPSPAFASFGAPIAGAVADAVARLLIERSTPLAEGDRRLPRRRHRDHAAPVAGAL